MTEGTTTEAPARQVRVVEGELVAPSASQGLLEVFRRRYLLKLLVERELASRYEGSALGFIWSYLNPLSQFFIYWFIMGKIMGAHGNIPNYPIHVFAGLIVTHFFTETFGAGTRSIVRNKALMTKMALPREMFPVSAMLVSLVHVGPQLVIMVIVCLFTGWHPDAMTAVGLGFAVALAMALGTALALLFSVANVFFRDFGSFVGIVTNYVRWGVPMVYSYEMVHKALPTWLENVYLADPIAMAVLFMQRAFWVTTGDDGTTAIAVMPDHMVLRGSLTLALSLIVLVIGQLVFSRFEKRIPERL
ncbi:ABC transporter permease [Nocardioides sp. Kera G14]|uniref:ABC transporter permease n=1 Tax=Nocardioides sp. Kera G14 TaxID=2884264 RepID=UPI001D125E75|nr:ABC transporter permease [Nocardioides sp. Kera G14]UDY22756.1 ABC transporter permease [Nocardioides sp. Kera G14]